MKYNRRIPEVIICGIVRGWRNIRSGVRNVKLISLLIKAVI